MPTKVLNLEFQPEFVHVAFSEPIIRKRQNAFQQHIQLNGGFAPNSTESAVSEMSGQEDMSVCDDEVVSVESLFGIVGE